MLLSSNGTGREEDAHIERKERSQEKGKGKERVAPLSAKKKDSVLRAAYKKQKEENFFPWTKAVTGEPKDRKMRREVSMST